MSVKLSAALPANERNGLPALASSLIAAPDDVHAAVILLRTKEIRTNPRSGAALATAEIMAVEAFPSGSAESELLRRVLQRGHERRTGAVELPLDPEPGGEDGEVR